MIRALTIVLTAALATVADSKPLPTRFDIVCTGQPIRTAKGEVVLPAPKFLRTIDTGRHQWCESTCTTIQTYSDAPGRLDLFDQVDRVGPGSLHMRLILATMTIEHVATDRDGTSRWQEKCRTRPFSGLRVRPPPY
jgi:hypothetical protein